MICLSEMNKKPDMVRVNTRISKVANDWLDSQTLETGVPKSTLIYLAIENYMRETEVISRMSDMGELVAKIEKLEETIQRKVPE